MINRLFNLVLIVCFIFTSTSCATIISGRNQDLPIVTKPSGAVVTIGPMKQLAPATFPLDRRQGTYIVKIEKKGYESVEITLKKGVNGWVFGNILLGLSGIIGLIIDISSGSASKFTPTQVEVDLAKKELGYHYNKSQDLLIVKLKEK